MKCSAFVTRMVKPSSGVSASDITRNPHGYVVKLFFAVLSFCKNGLTKPFVDPMGYLRLDEIQTAFGNRVYITLYRVFGIPNPLEQPLPRGVANTDKAFYMRTLFSACSSEVR